MALPLQPELRPWPRWQRRAMTLAALIAAVALIGVLGRRMPDPVLPIITGDPGRASYPQVVERLVRRAEERVWVMVFVCYPEDGGSGPVRDLLATLGAAKARGVDVRVVLDLGIDWGTDHVSDKHRRAHHILHDLGVPVVLDELDRTTHPKVVLVDDEHAVVGSHNWTRSAFTRNREVSSWHRDPTLVRELEPVFLEVPGFEPLVASEPEPMAEPEAEPEAEAEAEADVQTAPKPAVEPAPAEAAPIELSFPE